MFNHNPSANGSGGSDSQDGDFFSFLNPANWAKFGIPTNNDDAYSQSQSHGYSQQSHPQHTSHFQGQHASFGHNHSVSAASAGGMDWTSTPSTYHSGFSHGGMNTSSSSVPHENVELDNMGSFNGGGGNVSGVGKLVAQFENRDLNPPLPPRPNQQPISPAMNSPQPSSSFGVFNPSSLGSMNMGQHMSSSHPQSPPMSTTQFGSFNSIDANQMPSPVTSHADTRFGSFSTHSRVASPMMASPPSSLPFGGFHDSRVSTPTAGTSSNPFGNLNDFMSNESSDSAMMNAPSVPATTPSSSTPVAAPGTPGFAIWRPPPSSTTSTTKPTSSQSNNPPATPGGGYFRPPIPPKPNINTTGNQFIMEFNPSAKAKGKAPVKPPRPRAPSVASNNVFPQEIKQEPVSTSMPLAPSIPTPSLLGPRRSSVSLRAQAGTRPSREQVPAEAWESYKSTIRTLYLEERKPLKEVMSIMADKYGFQATPKMYKTRFSSWGFVKNNTEDEVKRLLSMKFQRDAEGKVSEFVRNGKIVNLGTYLKRKGVTEYDLVDFEQPADLPAHIRCRTPTPPLTPEHLRSPDLLRSQELVIGSVRKAFLQCRQDELDAETQMSWPSTMVWGADSSELLLEANFYFEAMDADQGGHSLMRAFTVLEGDLLKLSPQGTNEVLLGMVQRDPGMTTALCKYLSAYSSTNYDRVHPLRQILNCLYEVQQKHGASTLSDLLWATAPAIAEEMEAIYSRRHPYVARAWIDLAMFYGHANAERLDKLAAELRTVLRQLEQRSGATSPDAIALRYAIAQLHFAADNHSEAARHSTMELWETLKSGGFMCAVRDSRPNVYCFHCPVKVDPWSKRCRRRYDSMVAMFELHVGIKAMPYFEEDFHTTEHAPDSQDSWAAALGQPIKRQEQDPQDPWAAAMGQQGSSSGWGFI